MTIHSVVIQKLLSTNAHLGRRVAAQHFKIYSCGSRNAMTVIDSDKTLICLRNACHFIGNLVRQKGRFLFVNTNSLFDEIILQMTQKIGCRNDNSWRLGGFLTNSLSPRKFRGRNKKLNLCSIQPPDCIVIMDTERKSSVILEADKLQVPIVGLVDSSMPWDIYKRITYPVPANDSVQFVYLFCNLITKTFLYEQKKLAALAPPQLADSKADSRDEVQQLGKTGKRKDDIFVLPYDSLDAVFDDTSETKQLLDKLIVLKLNHSMGTQLGMNVPKSAVEVRDGLTSLDLTVNHIEVLNSKYGCNIPLLLMNTVNTHDATLKVLDKHPNKNVYTFIQGQHHQESFRSYLPTSSEEQAYDANHIEVYLSLQDSGKLDVLLSQGKEYVLVVNTDNLTDIVDLKILNHLVLNNNECCMEVMPKSLSNLKGSDLHSNEGKYQSKKNLKLTGTMWMSLKAIDKFVQRSALREESYLIPKFFDRAVGVNIPQSRYLPVETPLDLFLFQTDLYNLADGTLTRNKSRANSSNPHIELGPEFEKVSDFGSRFKSIPSIIELDSLKVVGDVCFGSDVTLKGKVSIVARPGVKIVIPDGAVIENKVINGPGDI